MLGVKQFLPPPIPKEPYYLRQRITELPGGSIQGCYVSRIVELGGGGAQKPNLVSKLQQALPGDEYSWFNSSRHLQISEIAL